MQRLNESAETWNSVVLDILDLVYQSGSGILWKKLVRDGSGWVVGEMLDEWSWHVYDRVHLQAKDIDPGIGAWKNVVLLNATSKDCTSGRFCKND